MTSGKSIARAYVETIVIATIVALFVRTFLFQAFKIHTGSMEQQPARRRSPAREPVRARARALEGRTPAAADAPGPPR